jgi:hypothetical protein
MTDALAVSHLQSRLNIAAKNAQRVKRVSRCSTKYVEQLRASPARRLCSFHRAASYLFSRESLRILAVRFKPSRNKEADMPNTSPSAFAAELQRRFEELSTWAIANSPNPASPLKQADFEVCRSEIARLADRDNDVGDRNASIPEPSENGPQYVNMNPTPWP